MFLDILFNQLCTFGFYVTSHVVCLIYCLLHYMVISINCITLDINIVSVN